MSQKRALPKGQKTLMVRPPPCLNPACKAPRSPALPPGGQQSCGRSPAGASTCEQRPSTDGQAFGVLSKFSSARGRGSQG